MFTKNAALRKKFIFTKEQGYFLLHQHLVRWWGSPGSPKCERKLKQNKRVLVRMSTEILQVIIQINYIPASIYLPKVNNRNTRTRCEICSQRRQQRHSIVFIVNFEHISHLVLVLLLLTYEHVIAGWDIDTFYDNKIQRGYRNDFQLEQLSQYFDMPLEFKELIRA